MAFIHSYFPQVWKRVTLRGGEAEAVRPSGSRIIAPGRARLATPAGVLDDLFAKALTAAKAGSSSHAASVYSRFDHASGSTPCAETGEDLEQAHLSAEQPTA